MLFFCSIDIIEYSYILFLIDYGHAMIPIEWLKEWGQMIRSAIFKIRCRLCDNPLVLKGEKIVCYECLNEVNLITDHCCEYCGKAIREDSEICGECVVDPPPFKKHISYGMYSGVMKELIQMYKYFEIDKLKELLAGYYVELFLGRVKPMNGPFDYLIPVPSDSGRKREFNPMVEISKVLSKHLEIEILTTHLIKVKKTPPQVGLSLKKRKKNLDGAFKLKNPLIINKKRILLIDDVYTTGTTVKRCAELLKRERAEVFVLTLARSV